MVVALEVIAVFVVIILVHELGHFLAAKAVGVGVERFSMGFGPVLLRRRVGETEYVLSAVPLGGYVKMVGEEGGEDLSDEERRRAFSHKPVARRFFIVFAGPFFNLVAAYALFAVLKPAKGQKKSPGLAAAAAIIILVVPAVSLASNYREVDNSRNFFAYDFGSNALKSVGHNAALFGWGDNGVFHIWYLQALERYRDDVFFVHAELLSYPWYMSRMRSEIARRYGVGFVPPASLDEIKENVRAMTKRIKDMAPVYFDYSTMRQLNIPPESLLPQGLVAAIPGPAPERLENIWGRYSLRGAFDGTTNRAFAAEGILDIYGWECVVWAQQAYEKGRLLEALKAYELAKKFGTRDDYLDRWAEDVRREVGRGRK